MKVLLLSKYSRLGASSRLRSLQYISRLINSNIDIQIRSLFNDPYLNILYEKGKRSRLRSFFSYVRRLFVFFTIAKYDIIWIEKEVFPYFPAFAERVLRWLGKPYVVDYDDAIFHNYDLSLNPVVRILLGKKIDVVMRNSACVIVGNRYLADRAREAGAPRVECIPTVVDLERYWYPDEKQRGQQVIGWIGSPSTQQYVVDIRTALKKACEATGAILLLVGATASVEKHFSEIPVKVVPWSEDSESELVRQMNVGIMPLKDGPWERGKCGYKLIQYMASGVPVVASPVGVNVEIVNGSHCGRLAGSESEWAEALIEILNSSALQSELGLAGRKAVEQKYSLQVQAPVLAGVFRTVARRGKT